MKDEDDIPEHSHIEHFDPNDKEEFRKQVEADLLTIGVQKNESEERDRLHKR